MQLLLLFVAWVGHACVVTAVLNSLYGMPVRKKILKLWRYGSAVVIILFPLVLWYITSGPVLPTEDAPPDSVIVTAAKIYTDIMLVFGGLIFPAITIWRLLHPHAIKREFTTTRDLWAEFGSKLVGDGKMTAFTRLPFNGVYQVDTTRLRLAVRDLPPALEGLEIVFLSDLHFHGTPSRLFFEQIFAQIAAEPAPDIVAFLGDYVDTDAHREWIEPLFSTLSATEAKLAILGNHDLHHGPDAIRDALRAAGCTIVSNALLPMTIRGVACEIVGHEGPWYRPVPLPPPAKPGMFRLCLSHSPDSFPWAQRFGINLMVCGHVHGGQIRIPIIGSIFIPSVFGRRYDQGVFTNRGTTMVVGRGLSGKEPIRFRCNPQVIRLTLTAEAKADA